MVGVLNGKKGKAFSVFVVAFLLCGVFGGLVVEQSLAVGNYKLGYSAVGSSDAVVANTYILINQWVLSLPDGCVGRVEDFNIYIKGNHTGVGTSLNCHGAIYDENLHLLAQTSNLTAGAPSWLTGSIEANLTEGVYYLAVGFSADMLRYYNNTGSSAGYYLTTPAYNFAAAYVLGDFTTLEVQTHSWYVTYDVVLSGVNDVYSSEWLGVGVSFGLVAISLLLALKSRSWAVNFLFGLSTVGFLGWEFANASTELFGGWLDFMVLVGAVLVLVKGAVLVRASGV